MDKGFGYNLRQESRRPSSQNERAPKKPFLFVFPLSHKVVWLANSDHFANDPPWGAWGGIVLSAGPPDANPFPCPHPISSSRYQPGARSASVIIGLLVDLLGQTFCLAQQAVLLIPDRKWLALRFLHFLEGSVQSLLYGLFCRCLYLLFQSCFGAGGLVWGGHWPLFFCKRTTQNDEQNCKTHKNNSTYLPVRLGLAVSRGWGFAAVASGPTCQPISPPSLIMPCSSFISCFARAWSHPMATTNNLDRARRLETACAGHTKTCSQHLSQNGAKIAMSQNSYGRPRQTKKSICTRTKVYFLSFSVQNKLVNINIFFRAPPGNPSENPGISHQMFGFPGFEEHTELCWPPPFHTGRPPPHQKISGPEILNLCSFFLPDLLPWWSRVATNVWGRDESGQAYVLPSFFWVAKGLARVHHIPVRLLVRPDCADQTITVMYVVPSGMLSLVVFFDRKTCFTVLWGYQLGFPLGFISPHNADFYSICCLLLQIPKK